ncbi:GSK-3-binding protein-like [Varanus komodoensis]|uniref:GSK-3-binding protein n=1 Tax=Varanus komodoensis TaxID=61221 RepID=A0A8D2KY10_VARKO|nr:GSK-3-binding protein-like [Varanus komodoensis]
MPCRRPGGERFLLLERAAVSLQSGPVGASSGSKEVDALVAKLGEVLQLSAQHRAAAPAPRLLPKHHGRDRAAPYSSPRGLGFLASLHHQRSPPSLLLLPSSSPPAPPVADQKGSPRVAKQLCGRGWLRSAARAGGKKRQPHHHHPLLPAGDEEEDDDDPHRLLQQLILSGNLIKEAVRRLQLAATATAASTAAETSATGSPGSASSTGSCCHSSSGEGDSAAATAFAVSSLQPLP